MDIAIAYDIALNVQSPSLLLGALSVHASRQKDLLAPEVFRVQPPLPLKQYQDTFGNRITHIAIPAGVQTIRLTNQAVVRDSGLLDPQPWQAVQHPVNELPFVTLPYILPSRYCDFDGDLLAFAWSQFGQTPLGWARVRAICDYVHQHIRFDYMQARATRSAREAWQERVGVCRDFSHLAVALCRSMNIPARYVTGYLGDIGIAPLPGPMDFSAWFEVYLGGQWHTCDARHNVPRIGRVLMAVGRDAADVPITMVFGNSTIEHFEVATDELPPTA